MRSKVFKISGILIILLVGIGFLVYGNLNSILVKAEKAYSRGDFEQAEFLYKKGMNGLKKWPFSLFKKEVEKLELARAWALYYQGYYNSEKYDLAEKVVTRELNKEAAYCKDQFYNLKALIYWQKGVDLFIKMGKEAVNLKELDKFLDVSIDSSGKAVKENDGRDWDIKYNYEFFRQPRKKLKNLMQRAAQRRKKGRKIRQEVAKQKSKAAQESQDQQNKAKKGKKEGIEMLAPKDKATQPTSGSDKKKKKKKG